jgi:AcrR family transcriptional regulator
MDPQSIDEPRRHGRAHRSRRDPGEPGDHQPRRTQAERSAETTAKLLDATAACLAELGYGHTSTTEVCHRAGVSRGAMLHHFPSKAVLVAAACDHVFQRRVEEFRAAIAQVPVGGDRIGAAIDITWAMFKSDTFAAWYELIMAGRTDPDLRPHVSVVAGRMIQTIQDTWFELFEPPISDHPDAVALYQTAPTFLFAVLDGLAVTRMTGMPSADDDADRVIAFVKMAARALQPSSSADPS